MNILVTGANGFIGKNLIAELENRGCAAVWKYDKETDPAQLEAYCARADFVFHLAGVNRPDTTEEFMTGNAGFTAVLLDSLKRNGSKAPVLITSSVQAALGNPYGASKKAVEELLLAYGRGNGVPVFVYRLPNVFGKWGRPNYNSAVATFCHNIARGLPIQVNDPAAVLKLAYIDDVVAEFIQALNGQATCAGDFCEVPVVHTIGLGEIVELLYAFKHSREDRSIPDMEDAFTKKLYSTYLSYLPSDQFSYPLKMNVDQRGSFTEFIKTKDRGQVSVNISKPGITKGNHWHHSKNEKFLVVSGSGVIRLRKVGADAVVEYQVSGDKLTVVDIPVGYTHNIENTGDADLVTIMWVNEPFDPNRPDTFYLEV